MGILMGALAGAGKAAGEIADYNIQLWGQQELQAQQQALEIAKAKTLADFAEQKTIAAEGRGMTNRATERQTITDETIRNAPALRNIKVQDVKAAKKAEYDPEIQALMRKAEIEKLTSAEQAKLKFYKENSKDILDEKRAMARAGHIDDGADLRAVQIEAANLSLTDKRQANKLMEEYETTTDPARKTAIKESLINRGILKPGSTEFDTEKVITERINPDGTTSKTEHTQRRRATDAPGAKQDVTYMGKVIGQASNAQEAAELVARVKGQGAEKPKGGILAPSAPRPVNSAGYFDVQGTIDGAKRGDKNALAYLETLIQRGETNPKQRQQIAEILKDQ